MRAQHLFTGLALTLALAGCPENKGTEAAEPAAAEPAAAEPAHEEAAAASQPATTGMKGATPSDRDQVDEDGVVRRGETLTTTAALSVSDCMAQAKELSGKAVKVEGTVQQVCAAKGCWWTMQGETPEQSIRITAKGYGFFVPRDAKGKKAVAEGVIEVKELSDAEAEHLAGESTDPNAKPVKVEIRLEAAGLEMRS